MQPRDGWNPKTQSRWKAFPKTVEVEWRRCMWEMRPLQRVERARKSHFPKGERQPQRSQVQNPCLQEKMEVCGLAVELHRLRFQKAGEGSLNKNHTASRFCRKLRSTGLRERLSCDEPSRCFSPWARMIHGSKRLQQNPVS